MPMPQGCLSGRARAAAVQAGMVKTKLRILLVGLAAVVVMAAGRARAAPIGILPIHVVLTAQKQTQLLTLNNQGDQPVRFELTAAAWRQNPDGAQVLKPTQDIVFFPLLLTIPGNESRRVRVGYVAPPGATEHSYRLLIQEIPNLTEHKLVGLTFLTRISLPIFVEPPVIKLSGDISPPALEKGRLTFAVRNTGTVHFVVQKIDIEGVGAGGGTVFSLSSPGWYVLPGEVRNYEVAIDDAACRRLRRIEVQATTEKSVFKRTFDVPAPGCAGAMLKKPKHGDAEFVEQVRRQPGR